MKCNSNSGRRCLRVTALLTTALTTLIASQVAADPGDLLTDIVTPVPSPSGTAIGIAADCEDPTTLYYTHSNQAVLHKMDSLGVAIGLPIPITDSATGAPVSIGAIQWDESRGLLWGGTDSAGSPVSVYLIDPTTGVATYQFQTNSPGIGFTDGISYDGSTDTVYVSDDVSSVIDEHDATTPWGLVRTLTPTDASGNPLGLLSGVLVGKGDLLYVGRNGAMTVDQIRKSDGAHLGSFAAPGFRVEDLECDLNSFAPLEAIWVKDAYDNHVAAFEVEEGTCQCGGTLRAFIDIKFCSNPNGFNCKSGGVMPMTVFGCATLLASDIDLDTVQLCLADDDTVCIGADSLRNANYFDRGSLDDVGAAQCAINAETGEEEYFLNPDGFDDLELAWEKKDVVETLFEGCDGFDKKEASPTLIFKALTNDGVPVVSVPVNDPGIDQIWRQK